MSGTSSTSSQTEQALSESLRTACRKRRQSLRADFAEHGIDGLLVSIEKDIRYLTGFLGHDSLLVIDEESAFIVSDLRYDEFLNPWRETGDAEVIMGTRHRLHESVAEVCRTRKIRHLGVQAEHLSLATFEQTSRALNDVDPVSTSGLVGKHRMKKDAQEVETIRRAVDVQQSAMDAALKRLTPGMTEMQFCAVLEFEMKWRGATGPSFDTMVSSGPQSSVIHYQTSEKTIEPGVLLVDWGAVVDGYCSDMTRVFGVEHLPERIQELYRIVFDAQQAAIDACAPGKSCAEIDAIARKVITDAGYGEYFGHGLGHGLGMDIHEAPYFNHLQTDVELEPGMVMTVEPGIYLPGVGGVRIEDDVAVTETGCEVLSNWPKQLDDTIIEWAAREPTHSG